MEQTESHTSFFRQLAAGLGTGPAVPSGWQPITACPLLIFVGVTGVGKSTTLEALAAKVQFQLLPNRRVLTDDLIISYLQQLDGQPVTPVTDRVERFALTRRYRERFPGGMGYALSQLVLAARPDATTWTLFDGLRGVNEVEAACKTLPDARFVVLDAPDAVRVQRLLGRGDRFDQIAAVKHDTETDVETSGVLRKRETDRAIGSFAEIGFSEADALFSSAERVALLQLVVPPIGQGMVAVADLLAKLKIVVEERRSYDPVETRNALTSLAPTRTLVIDTTQVSPTEAADQIARWLQ